MTSGTPQGLVLALVLFFTILINGINSEFECTLSKPTDNTKHCSVVDMLEGWDAIRRDLDKFKQWAQENLMTFSNSLINLLKTTHFQQMGN